jgi:hypothetical protein
VAAVFYPPLLFFSFLIVRQRDSLHRSLYVKYFIIALVIFLIAYVGLFSQYLVIFTQTHADQGTNGTVWDILTVIWDTAKPIIILSLIFTPILFWAKKILPTLALLSLSAVIPAFHLYLNRVPTLNKHLYMTVAFLAVIVGYSLSWLSYRPFIRTFVRIFLLVIVFAYFLSSRPETLHLEQEWQNTKSISRYLSNIITTEDRILIEDGGALVLSLYDIVYPPTHTTTFDWINYSGLQGQAGYLQAIKDQYFDYIELDGEHADSELHSLIHYHLAGGYTQIHQEGNFYVYAKIK